MRTRSEPTRDRLGEQVVLGYRVVHWRPVRTRDLFPDVALRSPNAYRWASGVGNRFSLAERRRLMRLPRGHLMVSLRNARKPSW